MTLSKGQESEWARSRFGNESLFKPLSKTQIDKATSGLVVRSANADGTSLKEEESGCHDIQLYCVYL